MDFHTTSFSSSDDQWGHISDSILLDIFNLLSPSELLRAGQTCKTWCRVSYDEILWKRLLYSCYKVKVGTSIAPGKQSWYQEFKRLSYRTPVVCSEVLKDHRNEVLHVSFSHNGSMFATSSKDGFIIVWNASYPVDMKYAYDMKVFSWKYTQFSQFNKSDTLLLVSGVHFGIPTSTSGEIAVFSLEGGFNLQCRVGNKPYDIFGTWFSDRYLLSGDVYWLPSMISTTELWINKASQETSSEHTPILNQLFRFYNTNASAVRIIMVADCVNTDGSSVNRLSIDDLFSDLLVSSSSNGDATNSETSTAEDPDEDFQDDSEDDDEDLTRQPQKLLIFTTGSQTYTPHQIGFKRINRINFPRVISRGQCIKARMAKRREEANQSNSPRSPEVLYYQQDDKYDKVDHILDLHGHIIGMCLSPDQRYLYVNSRPWPMGYHISNPMDPPPIAKEIDIHVIDLTSFKKVGKILRAHKAYTPNNECFFIFLDVSQEYVASGAEDNFGYIWDRHYEACIAKLPHTNVVNSVAFNPTNSEMLVTTSDDFEIKVWRSKSFMKEVMN